MEARSIHKLYLQIVECKYVSPLIAQQQYVKIYYGFDKALTDTSGAAEARRAHNPEDPGSKPGVANFFFFL